MKFPATIFIFIFISLTVASFFSCNKYASEDCVPSDDCYPYELDSGYVTIKITYNGSGPGVPVVLYDGYVEDNVIIWSDTVYQNEISFWLPTKKRYAAEAYYQVGGLWTVALDGKKLKEESYEDCGTTCYEVAEIILDLKEL
jgi:hypothetical protein